jgi:beta-glucanase (GH16 family)
MFAGDGRYIPPKFPAVTNAWTEIDDLETESPTEIEMGVNEWQHGQFIINNRCNRHYATNFEVSADYHLYGVEWTEQEITYYLDGKAICKQQYPPNQSPHDRLNIWLTSIAVGSGVKTGDQPSPASFGHVSYYVRDYYIRNTESGYAEYGSGWTDGLLQGYSRLGTRVSCTKDATAVWTPTIMQPGRYEVSVYRISNQHYDPASRIVIHSHDGNITKTVNFKTGDDGWVDLGTFNLDSGGTDFVTASGSSQGCLYADTVKFVRR